MRKICLLILLPLCIALNAFAQSTNISTLFHKNPKKADYYFDHFAYRHALEIYLQTFEQNPDNSHVRERIAMCYLRLNDPASAELWYRSLTRLPDVHASARFQFAEVLAMNGKYSESLGSFREYLKSNPQDVVAQNKADFLNKLSRYSDEHRFMIYTLHFNSPYSDYGVRPFGKGLVFASTRDAGAFIKRKPLDGISPDESFLNLYYAEVSATGDVLQLQPFEARRSGTFYHEGPIAFYDHFRKAAFTQTNLDKGKPVYDANGKVNLRIYFATVSRSGGFEPVAPFAYNSDAYSNAHPSFSADGKVMYFSSTSPAGLGGSDIYYSVFENGKWAEPANVGEGVNTREDESFPFIANDTTLYFSSNGHGSLGGVDIYVSYKREGKFSGPMNLGSPLNTRSDDFAFVVDSLGRAGYFASNRGGGEGQDDVYGFVASFYSLAGEVRRVGHKEEKVGGVRISAFNSNGDLIDSTRSDGNGNFSLDLPFDQDYRIRGEKDGFETLNDFPFSTRGKPFGVDSMLLPLWKQNLFAKGRIFSNETQTLLPGVTVTLHNLTDGITDTLVVHENGQYEFLVRPGKKYRIEGSKEGHIPNGFNLDTKGMVEGELLNDIVLEEIYIEKEVILFDYGKDEIIGQYERQLNQIIRTLRKFPRATLNVGAHADSRGSNTFNTRLSKKRAESTRQYLVSRGVSPSRIQLTWFGEELVLNRCSDGVECPEEEHSKNRRAELKVQKEPIN